MNTSASRPYPAGSADAFLTDLIEEVTNKFHAGEAVDIEAYVRAHPEFAEPLRRLLPALHVLANLGRSASASADLVAPPAPVPAAELGELGDFRIVREIGRGGMGVVYEAVQVSLGRHVALKVLPFAATLDPTQLQRFKNEAQAAARLHHTNIVPVFGVGCERGVHYYAMQFIEGQTLAAVIQELRQLAGLNPAATKAPSGAVGNLANDLVTGRWVPVKQRGGNGSWALPLAKPVDEACDRFENAWKAAGVIRERPRIEEYLGGPATPERSVLLRELVVLDVYYRRLHGEDPQPADYGRQFPELGADWCAGAVANRAPAKPRHRTSLPPPDATPPMAILSTERPTTSPAFFRTVAHLGVQAAEALEHAHAKGIVHRDVKPANLLVDVNGNLWVTDFGLARILNEAGLTLSGDLVGTLRYMSPEQALAKRVTVDARTDVYSLGATLYELLTLQPAYNGRDREEVLRQIAFEEPRPPSRWNKAVPIDLQTIVLKAMAKCPEERYATAGELADDLRRFLDNKPIRAKKSTLLDWTRKWARRHQGVVATGIGGLIVAVVILAVSTLLILSAYQTEAIEHQNAVNERQNAVTALYRSSLREAEALRLARRDGYRPKAWQLLQDAMRLDTPKKDRSELRQEAAACLGDFVGLEPDTWEDFPASIGAAALHPEGALLALSLFDGTIELRHIPDGRLVDRLRGHSSFVAALAFRTGGKELVAVDQTGRIMVWRVDRAGTWTCRQRFAMERTVPLVLPSPAFPFFTTLSASSVNLPRLAYFSSAALTPDGRHLAASWTNSPAALVRIADGTAAGQFPVPHGEEIKGLAVSPDGTLLAAAYEHQGAYGILVWDVRTHALLKRLPSELELPYCIGFSPDSKFLVCTYFEGVALYDTVTFQPRPFESGDLPAAVAFSPDSQVLAYQANNLRLIRLWDIARNRYTAALRCNHAFWVAFSQDGKLLVAVTTGLVRIWNLGGADEKLVLKGHAAGITSVVFSPDGTSLATSGRDHKLKIWNPLTGSLLKEFKFSTAVEGISFSPDGRVLAVGGPDKGPVRFYDVQSWEALPVLHPSMGDSVFSTAFSPKEHYFATAGKQGVTLWRMVQAPGDRGTKRTISFKPLRQLTQEFSAGICFSPDGRWLTWVDSDRSERVRRLNVWDLRSTQPHALPMANSCWAAQFLGFSADSNRLTFINDKLKIAVWDVATKQELSAFGELAQKIYPRPKAHLSADGAWYAVGDQTVTIWDMQAQKLLVALSPERSSVCSVGWSPDRKLLAVGGNDGDLEIWDLPKVNAKLAEIGLGW